MTPASRSRAEGVIVVAVGYLLVRAFWMVSGPAGRDFDSATFEATAKLVLWICGCFPVALWLAKRAGTSVPAAAGLDRSALRGIAFGLICTLPMFLALVLSPRKPFDLDLTFGTGVVGPIAEELLFRGFLFGLLWRVARWPVPVAIGVSALLFGFAHQTNVLPMAAGGAVLAWVAWRWNSLWPAIGLHGCMNLWWDLTRADHVRGAVGPDIMSLAQLLSVAIAVALTVRFSTGTASDASASSGVPNELTLANER